MSTDKNKHLECVLSSHKAQKEQRLLEKYNEKKAEIEKALKEEYGNRLYQTFLSGSFAKRTSINLKFDYDLMAPFKRNAFDTLEKMYDHVYNFLVKKYDTQATVRKQKVSIGLDFHSDQDGDVVKIDVVPGRELDQDQYLQDDTLNLYIYTQFGSFTAGSERLKSNVKAQIKNIREQADKDYIRQNIRLLKVWKLRNQKTPKSFFLELIVIRAFNDKQISGSRWDKLKSVMEYIRDNAQRVALPDPGNLSNNVADTLTTSEKVALSYDMKYMIERIEENSDLIKIYFPVNEKHPCEPADKSAGFSIKKTDVSVPPTLRFG